VPFEVARLNEFRSELDGLPFRHDFWERHLPTVDLLNFRGHQHYLYQDMNPDNFRELDQRLRSEDDWHLLDTMSEDGAFGALTLNLDGNIVSRDLLDSVEEITYLRKRLNWQRDQNVRLLDIGAGYGRIAHRLCEAMPNAEVWCSDAIPESLWVCESYLEYRSVTRAQVVSCTRLSREVQGIQFDVATAIHSLSECTPEGVSWWLDLLRSLQIPVVLYVANPSYPVLDQFEQNGYRLVETLNADLDHQPFRLYRLS
jgi:putative sugar O-methyltransferase